MVQQEKEENQCHRKRGSRLPGLVVRGVSSIPTAHWRDKMITDR